MSLRPGGSRADRVAHVLFARADETRPVLGFVWDAVRALAESGLEIEPIILLPARPLRRLQSRARKWRHAAEWPQALEPRLLELEPRPTLVPYWPVPLRSIESAAVALASTLLWRSPRDRPGLLHGSFLDEGGYAATVAAEVLGVPAIAVAHGSDVRAARGELGAREGRERRARFTLSHGARVLAVSEFLRGQLRPLGVEAELVRFTTFASRFPLRARERGAPPRVLFVGHISRDKGVDVLLEAIAHLERRDVRLRLVGALKGDLDPRAEARRLGIAERVEVLGPVPQEALAEIYGDATLTVLPSRHEGYGVVLVESLLVGRPVVGADLGGIREIVSGSVGARAAPGDARDLARAIGEVLARSERGELRAESLRAAAAPVTWEEVGPQLGALTRAILTQGTSGEAASTRADRTRADQAREAQVREAQARPSST